jgi:8-oxo-dGTP pyrophosphatase MutT (NUDIX family)
VEQYRHAVKRVLLETPAGHVDPKEDREAAARGELREETGYGDGTWHALGALHPVASRFGNQVHSYLALGVGKIGEPQQDENENLQIHEIAWAGFVAASSRASFGCSRRTRCRASSCCIYTPRQVAIRSSRNCDCRGVDFA